MAVLQIMRIGHQEHQDGIGQIQLHGGVEAYVAFVYSEASATALGAGNKGHTPDRPRKVDRKSASGKTSLGKAWYVGIQ